MTRLGDRLPGDGVCPFVLVYDVSRAVGHPERLKVLPEWRPDEFASVGATPAAYEGFAIRVDVESVFPLAGDRTRPVIFGAD